MSKGNFTADSGMALTVKGTNAAGGVATWSENEAAIGAWSSNPAFTAVIGNDGSGAALMLMPSDGIGINLITNSALGLFAQTEWSEAIIANSSSNTALGASSLSGNAVDANSYSGAAVTASSHTGQAVVAQSSSENAIVGYGNPNASAAVFSNMTRRPDLGGGPRVAYYQAAEFFGNVSITGSFTVSGTKGFRIDHPIKPKEMWLHHAAVESDAMKNLYDGTVSLDSSGRAVIRLPKWFEALNKDFRYLLTAIGASAPDLHISREIRNGRFSIAGGRPNIKVSWQVTGTRKDSWAKAHPFATEETKSKEERGCSICPEGKRGQRALLSSNINKHLVSADDFRKASGDRRKRYAAIKRQESNRRRKA
jgi:hypothetical protein